MYDFHSLWQLPAAAGLQGKHLGQLLRCAATTAPPRCAEVVDRYLRRHRAWSSVSEEDKRASESGAGFNAPISAAGTGGPTWGGTGNSQQQDLAVAAPAVVFGAWPMPPQATPSAPGNSWTWPLPAAASGGGH
uniref:Uncharacterized protein n=1 Tax=Tetradesmus obliquus TaxID=3088 RepID=A0A383WES4_TETOB